MTTAGATLFLFPTWIYLFHQLGVMLFTNAIIAMFFSFFFLAPLLAIAGPVGFCICKRSVAESSDEIPRAEGKCGLDAFPIGQCVQVRNAGEAWQRGFVEGLDPATGALPLVRVDGSPEPLVWDEIKTEYSNKFDALDADDTDDVPGAPVDEDDRSSTPLEEFEAATDDSSGQHWGDLAPRPQGEVERASGGSNSLPLGTRKSQPVGGVEADLHKELAAVRESAAEAVRQAAAAEARARELEQRLRHVAGEEERVPTPGTIE